jgi:hypothetical protein
MTTALADAAMDTHLVALMFPLPCLETAAIYPAH